MAPQGKGKAGAGDGGRGSGRVDNGGNAPVVIEQTRHVLIANVGREKQQYRVGCYIRSLQVGNQKLPSQE